METRPTTAAPRLRDMSTRDILSRYALADPYADLLAFLDAAAALGRRLNLKQVEVSAKAQHLCTYSSASYSITARDEWNELLAITCATAADCLAAVARENAARYGRRMQANR